MRRTPRRSKGPVLAPSSNEADENILLSDTKPIVQIIHHALIESTGLLQPTSIGQRQLHKD
jgi:hypothetical protein